MFRCVFLLGVALISFLATSSAYKACIDVKSVPTDEDWFIKEALDGWNLVEHSNCDNCEKSEAWSWLRAGGRSVQTKRMCWDMDVDTQYGPYTVPFDCKYTSVQQQECSMDFGNTDIKDKIAFGGHIRFTKTDNQTYVAGTTCIFGKENFWWIVATDKTELPASLKKELDADFIRLGFQANNVATRDSPLFIKRLSSKPDACAERPH